MWINFIAIIYVFNHSYTFRLVFRVVFPTISWSVLWLKTKICSAIPRKTKPLIFLGIKNVTISENTFEWNMNYLCRNRIPVWRAIPENTYTKRRFYSYFGQSHTQEKLSLLTATTKIQTPTCCQLFRYINKKICVKMCKMCKNV